MSSADDFFGGGNPSARFPNIGDTCAGTITRVGEQMQQRDYTTGEAKCYAGSTDPMMQLPIDVQTTERDPERPDDTGVRTLFVKGQMQKAFRTALRAVGAPGPRVGGQIMVTYVGDETQDRGLPAKRYEVRYKLPAQQAADSFMGADRPAAAPQGAAAPFDAPAAARRPWDA